MNKLPSKRKAKNKVNYYSKYDSFWKGKKYIVILFIIFIVLTGAYSLIQTLYGFANIYNYLTNYLSEEKRIVNQSFVTDSTELKSFLVFQDKKHFDLWNEEVSFRLGLPKHPQNAYSEEILENFKVYNYANWVGHPDKNDSRVRCGYNERVPNDLLNSLAERKYKFIKVSYNDIEQMGFIKDNPQIIVRDTVFYSIGNIPEFIHYEEPKTNRKWMFSPECNIGFVINLKKQSERRNKYLVDIGSEDNRNRISIFIDKEEHLCFRVIDNKCNAYVMRMEQNLYNKTLQYNFKFGSFKKASYMEFYLNGNPIAIHHSSYSIPFHYKNASVYFGANISKTYCAKMRVFLIDAHIVENNKIYKLLNFDSHNSQSMYVSDRELFLYKDGGELIRFHRR